MHQFRAPGSYTYAILALLKGLAKDAPDADKFDAWISQAHAFLRVIYHDDVLRDFEANSFVHSKDFLKGKHNQDKKRAEYRAEALQELLKLISDYESSQMTVFIGHGGASGQWEQLDEVLDMANLRPNHFSRNSAAGMVVFDRVTEMLDSARFAFLIFSAEDEQRDGKVRARQNVIHEAGLCQARLGTRKAIILLEEGCDKFSNNDGIVHIEFPKNSLMTVAKDIRGVLQREGLIPPRSR